MSCVETLAKEAHALALNKEIEKAGRKLKVMVQVNTSNEEQKGGLSSSKVSVLFTIKFSHSSPKGYI